MADVFITHIHEEAELARAIKRFLTDTVRPPLDGAAMMYRPLDIFVSSEPRSILPGEDWIGRCQLIGTNAITRCRGGNPPPCPTLTRPWPYL